MGRVVVPVLMIKIILLVVIVILSFTIEVVGQRFSVEHSPSPTQGTAASPTPDDRLRDGLKSMAENSRNLMGWGLTLIGGSILAIVSTSYMRPLSRKIRFIYLLFIPGWVLVGCSLSYGDSISRSYTAATFMTGRQRLSEIGRAMNGDFFWQLTLFNYGLIVFSVWLVIYITWWVVVDLPSPGKQPYLPPRSKGRRRIR